MISRLLLVEPSASMRYVLENYAQSLGFTVVAIGDYKLAEEALHQQFRSYGDDFAGVMLGWPVVPDEFSDALISTLEGSDFSDLPVIVLSTDMRAETKAWVAGRDHTSILPWKEYQSIDELLQKLLQQSLDESETFSAKSNNADISVLVVDDSVSIRYAMRDLFELQGYTVNVASGHDEAVSMAQNTGFDIAIIDFYLQGGTGDALCRRLITDPATGQVTCAMLTGTYADHIIKRSLRAGAVECMFKNESSELLLARVDALARFVRQRKSIAVQQRQLDTLVDTLAGATVVIDEKANLSYVSEDACRLLGYGSRASLLGQPASQVVDLAKIKDSRPGKFRAQWRDVAQNPFNVIYRQMFLAESNDVVINFKRLPVPSTNRQAPATAAESSDVSRVNSVAATAAGVAATAGAAATAAGAAASSVVGATAGAAATTDVTATTDAAATSGAASESVEAVNSPRTTADANQAILDSFDGAMPNSSDSTISTVSTAAAKVLSSLGLPNSSFAFVSTLENCIENRNADSELVSLLIVDAFIAQSGEDFKPANDIAQMTTLLEPEFKKIYQRVDHVAYLGNSRFGFILKHSEASQAYLLTRKVMQMCNAIDIEQQVLTINTTGCLLSVSANRAKNTEQLLSLAFQGVEVVNERGKNQALLLDLKRMLPVYASQNTP